MNLTLSIDDKLVERARELAKKQGTSLQDMIRAFLADATGDADVEGAVERLHHYDELALKSQRKRRGYVKVKREDLYAERSRSSKR